MNHTVIYRELGETTDAQIEFVCAYGGKFRLTTDLDLKGRGIKQTGNGKTHLRKKKTYLATEKAMTKLKNQYTCCYTASFN